jgi:hypothetical protein
VRSYRPGTGRGYRGIRDPWSGSGAGQTIDAELDCQALFTEDQGQALLVLTAPPRTEGYDKLQLLAVLGHERFADAGQEQNRANGQS